MGSGRTGEAFGQRQSSRFIRGPVHLERPQGSWGHNLCGSGEEYAFICLNVLRSSEDALGGRCLGSWSHSLFPHFSPFCSDFDRVRTTLGVGEILGGPLEPGLICICDRSSRLNTVLTSWLCWAWRCRWVRKGRKESKNQAAFFFLLLFWASSYLVILICWEEGLVSYFVFSFSHRYCSRTKNRILL